MIEERKDSIQFSDQARPKDRKGFKILPGVQMSVREWELLIEKVLIRILKEKYELVPKKKK